ncbi:hypothetical protein SSP531S_20910 [Streptomyces spongiicola]|uniref:Uncharacterized protein n=1 Tax=Streptomyces spongiicola TaxID=1690221 RepID=A0A388SVK1_9ACTN|nr:hypothetical protein SSP531S_20910 [Streptomyces spongiicola]
MAISSAAAGTAAVASGTPNGLTIAQKSTRRSRKADSASASGVDRIGASGTWCGAVPVRRARGGDVVRGRGATDGDVVRDTKGG